MYADARNGDMIECFNRLYTGGKVTVDYGIALMDKAELDVKKALTEK